MLSMAVRAVLIQSSSSTIPAYVMQCAQLPGKVLDGLDKVNRDFLWGSTESSKKMHWVGWDKVIKPKKMGGLGFQLARGRNIALLANLNWRFHTEEEAPWVKVLRKKYCTHQRLISRNNDKLSCFRVWSTIKKGKETLVKGAKWYIARESKLNFWFDRWSDQGPLRSLMQGPLLREEDQLEVKDVISASGWNLSSISMVLPKEVLSEIIATPFVVATSSTDRLARIGIANGSFSLQSAYELAVECGDNHQFKRQRIWKTKILPKIQFFL